MSAQASPAKAARAEHQAGAAAAVPGATRRFASMVIGKLLRAGGGEGGGAGAEGGSEGGGPESDAESEAGSVGSTASRETAATAATSAAASAGAGGAGVLPAAVGARVAALPAGVALGTPLAASAIQQCIVSLLALQHRLDQLQQQSEQQALALDARLRERQQARQQQESLAACRRRVERLRRRAAQAAAALEEAHGAAAAARRGAAVRAQALVTTLRVLQAAEQRLGNAEASLHGEEGRGRLMAALRELVARRCLMVARLGRIFQVSAGVLAAARPGAGFWAARVPVPVFFLQHRSASLISCCFFILRGHSALALLAGWLPVAGTSVCQGGPPSSCLHACPALPCPAPLTPAA